MVEIDFFEDLAPLRKAYSAKRSQPYYLVEVYIDNILFLGNDREELEKARRHFLETCRRYEVKLSEDSGVDTQVVFRGIHFDLSKRVIALKPQYAAKFLDRVCKEKESWADIRSLIGKIIYALQVLQVPLCRIFLLLKLLAKNVSTNPNTLIHISPSVRDQIKTISQVISKNSPRTVYTESVTTKILVTDAASSTRMWGAILLTHSNVFMSSGHLDCMYRDESINVAELEAVKKSILHFKIRDPVLRLLSDNSSTICWIKNGWCPFFYANALLQSILSHCKKVFPLYVPSGLNPADPLSRSSDLTPLHLEFLDYLRRTAFAVSWGGGGWTNLPYYNSSDLPDEVVV